MILAALKNALKEKEISIRQIAKGLDMNHSSIIRILNGTDTCSEATKQRVIKYIEDLLQDRPNLDAVIYDNANTFLKLISLGINNSRFDKTEKRLLLDLHDQLEKYSANIPPHGGGKGEET